MVCPSISVPIGATSHEPTFGFTAAARRSPNAPIGAADEVITAMKRGLPLNVEYRNKRSAASSSKSFASTTCWGSEPVPSTLRITSGDSLAVTGRSGSVQRNSAMCSTSWDPTLRNSLGLISSGATRYLSACVFSMVVATPSVLKPQPLEHIFFQLPAPVYQPKGTIITLRTPQHLALLLRQSFKHIIVR